MSENRDTRIGKITKELEEGIRDVFLSGRYEEYLKTMSRFHGYSLNNTILIHSQCPNASRIAGYSAWQKLGRYVRRGEKGITILAPAPYKKTVLQDVYDDMHRPIFDADGNQLQREKEIIVPMFRPVTVFDISQTDGEPFPELAKPLDGRVDGYAELVTSLSRVSPVPVAFDDLPFRMDGMYRLDERKILIRSGMSERQTVLAIVHEMAHALLHAELGAEEKDSKTKEVEAESVAYAVCAYYGIETGENSFGYIASWSKDKDLPELKKSLETVRITSCDLIARVSAELEIIRAEKEAEQDSPVSVIGRLEALSKLAGKMRNDPGREDITI